MYTRHVGAGGAEPADPDTDTDTDRASRRRRAAGCASLSPPAVTAFGGVASRQPLRAASVLSPGGTGNGNPTSRNGANGADG
ncbi:hypothetical protein [Mycolicibacterium sp. XJ1819]